MPAIKSEIANFYKQEVWKRVPKSQLKGRRTLETRWVFKKKNEQNGSIRYKARLVVKGYVQIPGVDFTDSFAPVATDTSVRILFAIALYYKEWTIEVIDVEAAFLEADLEEAVYIDWPEGVIELGFEGTNKVQNNCIRLDKAMYGTVQAALQWFKKLVEKLLIVGLTQSKVDPCVFFLKLKEEIVLIVAAHVDDCAIAGKQKWIDWFKREFKKHFTVKELGCLKKHLGVWYKMASDDLGRYLELTMEDFVKGIADDFAVLYGRSPKLAKTPGIPGRCLSKNTGEPVHHSKYRSLVGKILYFVKKISPVCANACRELSQHLDNPGEEQWNALERLLGYLLMSYENRLLKLRPPSELRAMDVVDSAYASNPDNRKSISAYIGTVGGGAIVSWQSKGQPIVTLSSTECEYVALADGSKETTFVSYLLAELDHGKLPSYISEDNTGAIFLTRNKQVGARTKHIDTRYHFIREKVLEGKIKVMYVWTADNPADVLSKNVTQVIHDLHASNVRNGTMRCWNREDDKMSDGCAHADELGFIDDVT